VIDEEAAQEWPDDARDTEDGAENPLVLAAFARADHVGDDRLCRHDEPAAAQSLQGAKADQLQHALADARQCRADQEDKNCRFESTLASVEIAELAQRRCRDRQGEQVGGDDPRELIQAAEIADDRRQGRRDDGLIATRAACRARARRRSGGFLAGVGTARSSAWAFDSYPLLKLVPRQSPCRPSLQRGFARACARNRRDAFAIAKRSPKQ